MTNTDEELKLILRKTPKNHQTYKKISKGPYNVFNEHNYFSKLKKRCILKKSIDLKDISIENNKKSENDSLPEWLKSYNSSSEDEDDVEDKSVAQLLIMEFQKDFANSYKVCPPFHWIHLIYLTIKNFSKEYVTCHDVHTFSRYWFPYYSNKSWINSILLTLNCPSNKYFNYSSSPLNGNSIKWTVNNESVKTLEESMMSVVKKYEKEIKSAMKYPDKLPTLLQGYGVRYLGYINVSPKSKIIKFFPQKYKI